MPYPEDYNTEESDIDAFLRSLGNLPPASPTPADPGWGGGGVRGLPGPRMSQPLPTSPDFSALSGEGMNVQEPRTAPQGPYPLSPPPPAIQNPALGQPDPSGAIPGTPLPRAEAEEQIRLAAEERDQREREAEYEARNGLPNQQPSAAMPQPQAAVAPELPIPNEQGPSPSAPMPAQTVEPSRGYDPIKILQEKYGSAIRDVASAREHDLSDMQMQRKLMLLSSMGQHAMGNTGAATALGTQAARLGSSPLRMESFQKQAEVSSLMSKASLEAQLLDPESPLAQQVLMGYVMSPTGQAQANELIRANPKLSPTEAKMMVHDMYRGASPKAMELALKYQKDAADASEVSARTRLEHAHGQVNEQQARDMYQLFQHKEKLYQELDTAGSPASNYMNAFLSKLAPEAYAEATDGGKKKLSGYQSGAAMEMLKPALDLMEKNLSRTVALSEKKVIIPGRREYRITPVGEKGGVLSTATVAASANAPLDVAIETNAEQAYYNALGVKEEINNLTSTVGAHLSLGQKGKPLRQKLQLLSSSLKAIGATQGQGDIDSLLPMFQDKNVTLQSVFPKGNYAVIDNALNEAARVARQRAGIKVPTDVVEGRLIEQPAIGYEGTVPGLGPVEIVKVQRPGSNQIIGAMRQEINGEWYYWFSDKSKMVLSQEEKKKYDKGAF